MDADDESYLVPIGAFDGSSESSTPLFLFRRQHNRKHFSFRFVLPKYPNTCARIVHSEDAGVEDSGELSNLNPGDWSIVHSDNYVNSSVPRILLLPPLLLRLRLLLHYDYYLNTASATVMTKLHTTRTDLHAAYAPFVSSL